MTRRPRELRFFALFMLYWLPVLGTLTLIIYLSAQPNLAPPIQFAWSDKVYHLIEYGTFGVLLARALRATFRAARLGVVALLAISLGIVVGTSDELFQSTVPGRETSGLDLFADTVGVALAQLAYRAFARD